ncbi:MULTISPECIES: dihydrodipicolinate reductase [unclassified Mycobacterium]|uniref:NAD(P)H-dependent amine dehydrogenase family protein n=1 Tax=unclassified Mycobacterium TaxID=2642494 RepID=UPI0029C8C55F|nr:MULTISPECIES: dihydrodipicolinate reductase [unclassified Mycobacterium]
MALRVVHCGTGNMGTVGLKYLLQLPDLELVGHYVWSPGKVGVDSGSLCGQPPTGVITTNDWQDLIRLDADCLVYFGDSIGREEQAIQDAIAFLERGTNVVSFSAFELAHPATAPNELRDPIEAACRAGNSSMFFTGIDPGWATTDLAIAALAPAGRVDCVRVLELGWWGNYTAEFVCREYFGFGKPPGFQPILMTGGFLQKMWAPTLQQITEALGVEIEGWETSYETDCLDHDTETGFGTVYAGTAAVVRFELRAIAGGRPIAIVEHVDAVARGAGNDWKAPFGPYDVTHRVEIEGDPSFTVEIGYPPGTGTAASVMPVLNSIPAVCAARPGLLGPLDVPRYWTRNVRDMGGNS